MYVVTACNKAVRKYSIGRQHICRGIDYGSSATYQNNVRFLVLLFLQT